MPKRVWVIEAMELGIPDGSKRRRMSKGMQDIEATESGTWDTQRTGNFRLRSFFFFFFGKLG
jgi:hypothetical protein